MGVKQLFQLDGRIALVTGGSRGLGLQMAEALGEMGARLAITARKADELAEAAAHLRDLGIEAKTFVCDIGQAAQVAPMVEAVIAAYGRIDILVNNAGTTWGAPAEDYPLDAWLKVVNLNLTGSFLAAQAVAKRSMIPNGYGKIINISSVAGLRASLPETVTYVAYNTTKGGLIQFTRALAAEWGRHNVTVNAIAPGFFPSRMTKATLERIGEQIVAETPLHRLGNDEDLKGLVVLLASDASRHITGQVVACDGGESIV
jgi:NAD(P)-dependent dehydrogenase (short-subunit alcohol dehydrogenase family)